LLSLQLTTETGDGGALAAIPDPSRSGNVTVVDIGVPGWTAARIASQPDSFWPILAADLQHYRVFVPQVQVIWLKVEDSGPEGPFPGNAMALESSLETAIGLMLTHFPNLKIVYLSSRAYAGYASSTAASEPYGYESGFAVKWLIERQINGAPELDVASGKFPWLAWGPYLWADGLIPRSDGLSWQCSDFESDGASPSFQVVNGAFKIARMGIDFFHSDSTARTWYLRLQPGPTPVLAALVNSAGWASPTATGSLATVFGTDLAGGTAQAQTFPLPHELDGTRVEVDGVPTLLYYASPTQINFVVPPTGGASVRVVRGENASAAIMPGFSYWAPGLYTIDGAPNGAAAAEHADGTPISSARPARRGETIQVFGTGLGYVNPLLAITTPEPIILLGGRQSQTTYAGPAPGLPGVTQVNFRIPEDSPLGDEVSLVFQLDVSRSNSATLAIAN
jgi:uncharacterized protein (TIGR03437 family)